MLVQNEAVITVEEIVISNGNDAPIAVETDSGKKPFYTKKKVIVLCIILGVALILLGVIAVIAYQYKGRAEQRLAGNTIYPGIVIEGIDMGGKTKEEAKKLLAEKQDGLRQPVSIRVGVQENEYTLTEDDFEYQYNTNEIVDKAYNVARKGNLWLRYFKYSSLKESPVKYEIDVEMVNTDQSVNRIVKKIVEENNRGKKDTKIGKFDPGKSTINEMFGYEEGVVGIEVNEKKIKEELMAALEPNAMASKKEVKGSVTAEVKEIPYETNKEDLMSHIKELGSFSTTSTNTADGTHNMATALQKINGKIVEPGEVFSFNETVGRRTAQNGFRQANVIENGQLVPGYGGGVCQASTTVYGAAIRSGVEVVERGNHRWPSTYVPTGVDAMVSWGSQDFKFKNTSKYPLYIKSYVSGNKLFVTFYGDQPDEWDKIEVTSWTTETLYAGGPQYENDNSLPKGQQVTKSAARNGSKAAAQRIYYKNGTEVKRESLPASHYRPVGAIIRVGTGAGGASDTSQKPAEE